MAGPDFIQLPPDSTGKRIRTRSRLQNGNEVHDQGVFQTAPPTYYALADAVAFAQNKHLISIYNAAGSGVFLNIQKLFLINVQLSNVTGVMIRANVASFTSEHSGGTAITPRKADSDNPDLPAGVTVRTAGTVTPVATLFPLGFSNDEVGATQGFPSAQLLAGLNWFPEGNEIQSYRLREGEGLTVQQITNSTVGSFSYLIVFTMEDEPV